MMSKICSLRQHDLDQVIRVERGSLLSVPHRGTPRSVVGFVIRLVRYFVNMKINQQAGCLQITLPCASILPSSAIRADSCLNRGRGNR